MQGFGRFLLSLLVALLAAFVVGLGSCVGGFLLILSNQSIAASQSYSILLLVSGILLVIITFILVMVSMWRALNRTKSQPVKFKLPPKTTDQPPPDSKA